MPSNCWIAGYIAWRRHRHEGAELVFEMTRRRYWWRFKAPHCYVRLVSGRAIEYVPRKDDLGNFPPPLFRGRWRRRD